MTDAHLGENPLFVGLRRLLSELRTKLARFACSNSASNLPAMLTKWTKLPTECLLYMGDPFLLYWICHMKTAYWFAPTFFIANNVESRRYT